MSDKHIVTLYEKVAIEEDLATKNQASDLRRRSFTCQVLGRILALRPAHILEVGPGSGFITQGILPIIEEHCAQYYALDFSKTFLEKTYNNKFDRKNFFVRDICSSNFKVPKKFDVILFQEVLEHLTAPYIALENLNKSMKRGGLLLLTTPNSFEVKPQIRFILKKPKLLRNTHIAELSPLGLIKLLSMSGFKVIEIHFNNYRFKLLPKVFGQLFSSEVFIVAEKIGNTSEQWNHLTRSLTKI